jgi:hypothetical protein
LTYRSRKRSSSALKLLVETRATASTSGTMVVPRVRFWIALEEAPEMRPSPVETERREAVPC